jgi:hypothetical protein
MTLLGPPLHDLSLEDVQRFLDDADSEPLLWEAKGSSADPHVVRKEICGFANGREPAYLILGAEKVGEKWSLGGMNLDGDPPAWVSNVVSGGLRPEPSVDVRSIAVGGEKHVAVVEIPPVAVAPCICRGTVYERVSGRTVPVKEPIRLADLYGRGETARGFAESAARDVAFELFKDPGLPGSGDPWPRVAVAVGATGHPPDISSRLFSESYESALQTVVKKGLIPNIARVPEVAAPSLSMGFEQSNRFVDCRDLHTHAHPRYWHVRAVWNGVVGVYGAWEVERVLPEQLVEELIRPVWRTASILVRELGGFGPVYCQLLVEGREALYGRDGAPMGLIKMSRGPIETEPSEVEIESVDRELRRATGEPAYEQGYSVADAS